MAKCLIAGLPSAGKSTYIGALAYLLREPVKGQILRYAQNPEDLSYLNRLTEPWLRQRIVERTTRGTVNNIDLLLKREVDNKTIDISLPDIAGEEFASIIQKQSEVVKSWSDKPDSMLFFINEWPQHTLAEQFDEEDKTGKSKNPPVFEVNKISADVRNMLLIKELHAIFHWKKMAIGISSWDLYDSAVYPTPSSFIKAKAPFLYNFIKYYFSNTMIFGVSDQGIEYKADSEYNIDLEDRTLKGERAYVVTDKGGKSFDLTLPIDFLIS